MADIDKKLKKSNTLLFQEQRRDFAEIHQMDILRNLCVSLAAIDNRSQALKICLEACLQVSDMECGGIYLFDEQNEKLNLNVHKGLSNEFVNDILSYDKESDRMWLITKGKPFYAVFPSSDLPLTQIQHREGLKAFAAIPMLDKLSIVGCINLASHTCKKISASSRVAVEAIAAITGSAIVRLKAKKVLEESEEHLSSLMLNAENFALYRLSVNDANPHELKVVFASPSIIDILGVATPNQFESWFANIHKNDIDRIINSNLQGFQSTRFNEVMRIYHPRRKENRWIHAISKGIMTSTGKLKYVNGVIFDITKEKHIENALLEKEKELKAKSENLKEINTALDVLLRKREKDRRDLQQQMLSNLNELVFHQLDKLKTSKLEPKQREIIDSIESNLKEVTGQFSLKLSSPHCGLTHVEIEVANFVKHGKTTKEIASLLNLSPKTIQNHRNKIREKLGLNKKRINLRSYLLSIQ